MAAYQCSGTVANAGNNRLQCNGGTWTEVPPSVELSGPLFESGDLPQFAAALLLLWAVFFSLRAVGRALSSW